MRKIEIQVVSASSIIKKTSKRSKYIQIYDAIKRLKPGKALLVTFPRPIKAFNQVIYANFRSGRFGYTLGIYRQDDVGKVWGIKRKHDIKIERVRNEYKD